jgi:dihydrofolate synthase/folylpolyglutamate synthase
MRDVKEGLENTVKNTGLKGRWQLLYTNPTVVCDTGHNEAGIRQVLAQISATQFRKLHMVLGMVRDKDVDAILALLPRDARYYFCQANIPRALDADELAARAQKHGLEGVVVKDVNEARKRAMSIASTDDFIFIGGSTYVVAELDEL